jgi:hypothetical protein
VRASRFIAMPRMVPPTPFEHLTKLEGDVMQPARRRPNSSPLTSPLLPGESPDIRQDVADLIARPDEWMDTPNNQLGGEKPRDFVGTNREQLLRDLLRAVKYGLIT